MVPGAAGALRVEETTEKDGVLTVRYSGAATENNRMLALAVCDAEGNTLQYIRLLHPETSGGSLEISRSEWGLPDPDLFKKHSSDLELLLGLVSRWLWRLRGKEQIW